MVQYNRFQSSRFTTSTKRPAKSSGMTPTRALVLVLASNTRFYSACLYSRTSHRPSGAGSSATHRCDAAKPNASTTKVMNHHQHSRPRLFSFESYSIPERSAIGAVKKKGSKSWGEKGLGRGGGWEALHCSNAQEDGRSLRSLLSFMNN